MALRSTHRKAGNVTSWSWAVIGMAGARGRRPSGRLAGSWEKVANHILPKKNQHLLPCCYKDDVVGLSSVVGNPSSTSCDSIHSYHW